MRPQAHLAFVSTGIRQALAASATSVKHVRAQVGAVQLQHGNMAGRVTSVRKRAQDAFRNRGIKLLTDREPAGNLFRSLHAQRTSGDQHVENDKDDGKHG